MSGMEIEPTTTVASPATTVTSLPFKRVVIYKNGVAYFEREGKVTGNSAIELQFKPDEMNDIIRSLRVVDLDGGKIANISYESPSDSVPTPTPSLPGSKHALAEAAATSAMGTNIFNFLIGSSVSIIQNGSDKVLVGRVIGTNERVEANMRTQTVQLLVDNTKIHFMDIGKIASMEIIDHHVQGRVKENLDSILNTKKKDIRRVSINCKGNGTRTVRLSYILENPIWKSSYRVYMKHNPDPSIKEKLFFLEGWACVDNISEDDWNDVTVSLVSGSPISFQHEVYNPIIGIRPTSFSDEGRSAANITMMQNIRNQPSPAGYPASSPSNNNNMHQLQMLSNQMQMQQMQNMQNMQQMQGQMPMQPNYSPSAPTSYGQAMDLDAQTVEIGNLFHYEITTPITVKKDHSSLVPTVSGQIKGRKVCWFDPKKHAVNPMESIMLKNTMGTILDKGPVIVTEEESYLGESIFENTMMQDEHKLLAYSVNLECKVSKTTSSSQARKTATITGGHLSIYNKEKRYTDYVLANNSEHEIELVLDHETYIEEKMEGAKNQAKWRSGTRFYVMLPPLKKTPFTVHYFLTVSYMDKRLMDLSAYTIANLCSQKYLNSTAYANLSALYLEAVKVSKLAVGVAEEKAKEEQIINDQKRIQSLINPSSHKTQTFENQLTELEKNLAEVRKKYSEKHQVWKVERTAVEKHMNDLRVNINLETEEIPNALCDEVSAQLQVFNRATFNELLASPEESAKRQRY